MTFNRQRLRQLHRWFAPIMVLPLMLTLFTGALYQVAILTGEVQDFLWLLELHTGKFGALDLQFIYPFLNAFGVLILAVTGITMWWQLRSRNRR
ncbi:PepSY domain-containing protein [Euhalothece natronophila Z-M001]|uniref:PepSY domain-containing protein n=1 Tax=Euhalothece natronophila Z-M001 TaxID=522448 RepID=A0A5B8NJB6_9CHRO|nr:PepSY domain-containing protein [Euhalothece natronophila]QDZ38591.1 PepSY domain-containing protein [Euhalothece natronophila Z-M001]